MGHKVSQRYILGGGCEADTWITGARWIGECAYTAF